MYCLPQPLLGSTLCSSEIAAPVLGGLEVAVMVPIVLWMLTRVLRFGAVRRMFEARLTSPRSYRISSIGNLSLAGSMPMRVRIDKDTRGAHNFRQVCPRCLSMGDWITRGLLRDKRLIAFGQSGQYLGLIGSASANLDIDAFPPITTQNHHKL